MQKAHDAQGDEIMAERTGEKKDNFFKGVRREYKKVSWPTRAEVGRQTVAVVIVSVLVGILISALDVGFSTVINLLMGV